MWLQCFCTKIMLTMSRANEQAKLAWKLCRNPLAVNIGDIMGDIKSLFVRNFKSLKIIWVTFVFP